MKHNDVLESLEQQQRSETGTVGLMVMKQNQILNQLPVDEQEDAELLIKKDTSFIPTDELADGFGGRPLEEVAFLHFIEKGSDSDLAKVYLHKDDEPVLDIRPINQGSAKVKAVNEAKASLYAQLNALNQEAREKLDEMRHDLSVANGAGAIELVIARADRLDNQLTRKAIAAYHAAIAVYERVGYTPDRDVDRWQADIARISTNHFANVLGRLLRSIESAGERIAKQTGGTWNTQKLIRLGVIPMPEPVKVK